MMNDDDLFGLAALRRDFPDWTFMVTPNGVIIAERPDHIMWERTVSALRVKLEAAERDR
jgi:hypothetical protein